LTKRIIFKGIQAFEVRNFFLTQKTGPVGFIEVKLEAFNRTRKEEIFKETFERSLRVEI